MYTLMSKKNTFIYAFLGRYRKLLYYTIPILAMLVIAFASNLFYIDKKVINRESLWDMAGRPYNTFLYELNLPSSVGAIFVAGGPDNLEKTEKYYKKVNIGDIFTSQLRSLFGESITVFSIAAYINFMFGISAVVFSLLVGYLILKNGYISILIFLLIVIFRNLSQGLIYGLPLRHAYAVFNPLMAFSIFILIIMYLKSFSKKYLLPFIMSGFLVAYISFCRTSEGHIIIASLLLFSVLIGAEHFKNNKIDLKKILFSISIMLAAIYIGYAGFYKMIAAFEYQRDNKFNFSPNKEEVLSSQPAFHNLYVSLFRYEIPNRYGDKIGYDAVYERYPEIRKKFSNDMNYFELANSAEYNKAIKELYFSYVILNNPGSFLTYLSKSIYDYLLFLPYYSWTGNKSAHAYLPKINERVEIEAQDLAPDFKDTSLNLILNLKLKYLPESMSFWLYFICAYTILVEAIYTSFISLKKNNNQGISMGEALENKFHIYLLWGMLIYFFFASVVRILIPVHGQGAVVAFNIIIIYNLVRIAASIGIIETKKIVIPAIKMSALSLLLAGIFLSLLTIKGFEFFQEPEPSFNGGFESDTRGWRAYKADLHSVENGQSGNALKVTTSDNATGYAYYAVSTETGKHYKITAYFKSGTAATGQIKVGTTMGVEDLYYSGILSDSEWTPYIGVFKATTPLTYITLVNLTSVKGQTSFFDTIRIVKNEED